MMRRMSTIAGSIAVAGAILGGSVAHGAEPSDWQELNKVGSWWSNDKVLGIAAPNIPNPASCEKAFWGHVDDTIVDRKMILSVALSALNANRKVKLVINGDRCSSTGRPLVQGIIVK